MTCLLQLEHSTLAASIQPRLSASWAALTHVRGQVDPECEGPMASIAYNSIPATTRTLLDATAECGSCRLLRQRQFRILVAAAVFTDCLYLEEKYEHVEVLAAPELTDHWRLALLHQSLIPHGAGAEG